MSYWGRVRGIFLEAKKINTTTKVVLIVFGDPYGNRTHDSALRGPRLNRLTNGPFINAR